jgi:Laminin G domain
MITTRINQALAYFMALMLISACNPKRAEVPQKLEYLPQTPPSGQSGIQAAKPVTLVQSPNVAVISKLATKLSSNKFSSEVVGTQPTSFVPAVGHWLIGVDGTNKVMVVDGRKWQEGEAAEGITEQARTLFGDRQSEFLTNVNAHANFPFAVSKTPPTFSSGEINLRFKPINGRIDQAAGILFNLQPNGDYLTIRANALEDNLVLFKYEKGRRSSVKSIQVKTPASQQWHELAVSINGNQVKGYLDGKLALEHTLATPVSGKVGIWSKADSVVYFDDFNVKVAQN